MALSNAQWPRAMSNKANGTAGQIACIPARSYPTGLGPSCRAGPGPYLPVTAQVSPCVSCHSGFWLYKPSMRIWPLSKRRSWLLIQHSVFIFVCVLIHDPRTHPVAKSPIVNSNFTFYRGCGCWCFMPPAWHFTRFPMRWQP